MQSVQTAERKPRFRSNLTGQDLYIAGNVTKSAGENFRAFTSGGIIGVFYKKQGLKIAVSYKHPKDTLFLINAIFLHT